MCIIMAAKVNIEIPEQNIQNSFKQNPDGAGYMFVRQGKVVVRRGYMDVSGLLRAYQKDVRAYPNSPFVMHCRISTSGKVDVDNCHPFLLESHNLGIAHNGIMREFEVPHSAHSDTWHFSYGALAKLPKSALRNAGMDLLLESLAKTTSSKFAVLTGNSLRLYNEAAGVWDKGVWYSNSTYIDHYADCDLVDWCDICEEQLSVDGMIERYDAIVCPKCAAELDEAEDGFDKHSRRRHRLGF